MVLTKTGSENRRPSFSYIHSLAQSVRFCPRALAPFPRPPHQGHTTKFTIHIDTSQTHVPFQVMPELKAEGKNTHNAERGRVKYGFTLHTFVRGKVRDFARQCFSLNSPRDCYSGLLKVAERRYSQLMWSYPSMFCLKDCRTNRKTMSTVAR